MTFPRSLNLILFSDFDSTMIRGEALNLYFAFLMRLYPDPALQEEFDGTTEAGMLGQIPFDVSLVRRMLLIIKTGRANRETLKAFTKELVILITRSFLTNKEFFVYYAACNYIISGGFEEMIFPVSDELGIRRENIHANRFIFNKKGDIIWFDETRLTSKDRGKELQVRALDLLGKGRTVVTLGDSVTDDEMPRDIFIAYMEHVKFRPQVAANANAVVYSFDEVLGYMASHLSLSQ